MARARFSALFVSFIFVLGGTPARADEAGERERAVARELGQTGIEDLRQERWADGLEKLDRAYAIVPAPTLGLWSARAMIRLGKWVEASERLIEVSRLDVGERNPGVQAAAQKDAASELETLLPKIPKLTLHVRGVEPKTVTVTLDGSPIDVALLGLAQPANPGTRAIVATRGETKIERTVDLAEGASETIELAFEPEPPPAAAPETLPPLTPAPRKPPTSARAPAPAPRDPDNDETSSLVTAGWVGIGVGAAGVIVGSVFRAVAADQKSSLDPDCVDDVCPRSRRSDVDAYNRSRITSNVAFVVGGVGLATGAGLVLFGGPSERGPERAHVEVWTTGAVSGVRGAF